MSVGTNQVFYLNTTIGLWSQAPSMLSNRTKFAASSGNGRIIVAGGVDNSDNQLNSAERFDGEKWSVLPDIPDTTGWSQATSASGLDGSLWMAGGKRYSSSNQAYGDMATFSLSDNTWTVNPALPTLFYPRYLAASCIADDGYLYIAQGLNFSAHLPWFERVKVYNPPVPPVENLHTTKNTLFTITWNWTIPENSQIERVNIALNGKNVAELSGKETSYKAVKLKRETYYQIGVQLQDAGGRSSQWEYHTAKTANWSR